MTAILTLIPGLPLAQVERDGSPGGTGDATAGGMEQPLSRQDCAIAPGGHAFQYGDHADRRGNFLVPGVNSDSLTRPVLDGGRVTGEGHLLQCAGLLDDCDLLILIDTDPGQILPVAPRI
ncbi:PQQ-dependent sugar dehydrogenase [Loktanella fryxellensis]|nr:PQQ-dependent sugar dehydrogenase [Loktanella fryxellensis]